MEIQGKIIQVLPLQSGTGQASGKAWKKQEYILETVDSQYPRKICFNLWGDNIDKFALQQGEDVTVQIDIESREYNGRWYTDVRAWRIDRGLVSLSAPQPMAMPTATPNPFAQPTAAPAYQQATQPVGQSPFGSNPLGAAQGADDLPF